LAGGNPKSSSMAGTLSPTEAKPRENLTERPRRAMDLANIAHRPVYSGIYRKFFLTVKQTHRLTDEQICSSVD